MARNYIQDFNDGLSALHEGRLSQCNDATLQDYLTAAERWEASGNPMTQTGLVINAVRHELSRRQKEKYQDQTIKELNLRHQETTAEVKRMFSESAADSDKKHTQSLSISQEANALSRKAISVSQKSFLAAVVIGLAGLAVSLFAVWRSDNGASNVGTEKTQSEKMQVPAETPQIVSHKLLPTLTNSIQTNGVLQK